MVMSLYPPKAFARQAKASAHRPARVDVLMPHDLTAEQVSEWRHFQRQTPALESPYLCPEFVRLVAGVRPGVAVAVAEEDGRTTGFFAFERRGKVGRPVGGPLSDCQAVIAAPDWQWDARALVEAAGLSVFDFTNLRAEQRPFAPFHRTVTPSHVIDVTDGFDAYARERGAAGRNAISQTSSHLRRLERRLGPFRFTLHEPDPMPLPLLIDWKRQQCCRTGAQDAFSYRWTVELLERIHATQTETFAGVLSTLSVGDRIIAAHMGMRSSTVLHWWFPAYDVAYTKLAPGRILLLELIKRAAGAGIRSIELGYGDEDYKLRFANSGIPVAAGFVGAATSLPLWYRQFRHGIEGWAGRLPIGQLARLPGKVFHRIDRLGCFR
jgi:CelD/BcsL family acetyltransferase involved in cellulose biosynthesis